MWESDVIPGDYPTDLDFWQPRDNLGSEVFVRVIGVEEAEGHALLYQLVPEVRELGEVAPVELVDAIRGNVSYSTEII